eukprot:m.9791 g.9791  ORF g.9791 m.9791 type:complete len:262 (-) comp7929_c0_seq1:54-839(-)
MALIVLTASAILSVHMASASTLPIKVTPIEHASVLISYPDSAAPNVYSDPVDAKDEGLFDKLPLADVIVITHSHSDHFQPSTIFKLLKATTKIAAPQDVGDMLITLNASIKSQISILHNWDNVTFGAKTVHAVPMYNTGPNPHHPEGKWNGYVLEYQDTLVYLSGDTSYIPPMDTNFGFKSRFDLSFLCMNLPYTMGVEEAAKATHAFRPKEVTPYHYRNADDSFSNLTQYKSLVDAYADSIDVKILNFYPHGPVLETSAL